MGCTCTRILKRLDLVEKFLVCGWLFWNAFGAIRTAERGAYVRTKLFDSLFWYTSFKTVILVIWAELEELTCEKNKASVE